MPVPHSRTGAEYAIENLTVQLCKMSMPRLRSCGVGSICVDEIYIASGSLEAFVVVCAQKLNELT